MRGSSITEADSGPAIHALSSSASHGRKRTCTCTLSASSYVSPSTNDPSPSSRSTASVSTQSSCENCGGCGTSAGRTRARIGKPAVTFARGTLVLLDKDDCNCVRGLRIGSGRGVSGRSSGRGAVRTSRGVGARAGCGVATRGGSVRTRGIGVLVSGRTRAGPSAALVAVGAWLSARRIVGDGAARAFARLLSPSAVRGVCGGIARFAAGSGAGSPPSPGASAFVGSGAGRGRRSGTIGAGRFLGDGMNGERGVAGRPSGVSRTRKPAGRSPPRASVSMVLC